MESPTNSSTNFIQVGEPQQMESTVTVANTGSGSDTIYFNNDTITTDNIVSTTATWTGYPYWNEPGYWTFPWQYPYPVQQPFVITSGDEKIVISLKEANDLKRAASKDPKLAKILKKFEDKIEIDTDGLF